MSLEENATPDSSPESNIPVEKTETVQEEVPQPSAPLEQAVESVAQPEQSQPDQPVAQAEPAPPVEPTADSQETEPAAEAAEATPQQPATGEAESEQSSVAEAEKVSSQETPTQPASSDIAASSSPAETEKDKDKTSPPPRVALNPVGAEQAKAVPTISSDKTEQEREAEAQAKMQAVSAEAVPVAEPVDIPASEQLDTDLEAQLDAALQGSKPESETSGSESTQSDVTSAINMPKDDADLEPGLKLKGKVDAIDEENIVIDIGFRMSGILSKRNLEGGKVPELGALIDVVVGSVDLEEGLVHLAMPKAVHRAAGDWNAIAVGQVVECTVEKTNKGGLSVLVSQLKGFMPAGQVDLYFVGDLEPFVGQKLTAKVIDVNPKKRNLVVSRRALLQEERDQQAAVVWENLTEGEQRTGTVKTIKEYGAFVDIGGVDGLLHVREMGWTRIKHPSDILKQGQQIEVKVLSIDNEKKKISLGMKQLLANPWDYAEQKFAKNTVVTGVVKKITDFGAFVEIEEGLEGLIHVSELDFRRVNKVSDILKEGQEVEAQVLEINKNKQRISLSIKALKPKPQVSPEKIAQQKAEAAEEKQRREAAEKRRLTLKGGNSNDKAGGLFGNPGDYNK